MRKKSLFIARQSGHPEGWFGHIVARVMARSTEEANGIALRYLDIEAGDSVLEIGFGHGRTLRKIAGLLPTATIAGVDPSDVMVSTARQACRGYGERVDLRKGAAETLPFDDGTFHKELSVHSTYFWPQLVPGLREVRRVLRDDGRFVLGFRPRDNELAAASLPESVYSLHSIRETESALSRAGFENVSIERTALKKGFMAWAICN